MPGGDTAVYTADVAPCGISKTHHVRGAHTGALPPPLCPGVRPDCGNGRKQTCTRAHRVLIAPPPPAAPTPTAQGVLELESFLPARLLAPKASVPLRPNTTTKLDYRQRQEVAVQRDLKAVDDLLSTAKARRKPKGGRGGGRRGWGGG